MTKTLSALAASWLVAAVAGQALALNPQPLPPRCVAGIPCGHGGPTQPHPLAHGRHHRHHHHHHHTPHGHGHKKKGGDK